MPSSLRPLIVVAGLTMGCSASTADDRAMAARLTGSGAVTSSPAPSIGSSPAASASASTLARAPTRPPRAVWGEITRHANGSLWIEDRIEIAPSMLEAASGPGGAEKWIDEQADMELELGVGACTPGLSCPLGRCRIQVEKVVSIESFEGKPEWQRPAPKHPKRTVASGPVIDPLPEPGEAEAKRCARECEPTCDDRWLACVENCLMDVFPLSGASTR